ncbi:MAG: PAS domain S-box protein [Dehalococcoidales bacterium]|nr:PAS domain S-box protein [Dehalococcoidales bacterium]
MRILVIEDNPGDARLVQETLKEGPGDYTLEIAERLKAGLDLLNSREFDVVMLDLNLPDSHGLETLTSIQKGFPKMPIVLHTSIDDEELAVQATRQCAEDYLVKGQADNKLLRRTLLNSIERKHMRDELAEIKESLERKVKERTFELTTAYEELWLQSRLLDMAADAISIRNSDHIIIYTNQAASRIYGYSREEFLGMKMKSLVEPNEAKHFEERVKTVIAEGKLSLESLHIRKDGSIFPVELTTSIVKQQQGDYYVTVARDITARRKTDAEKQALAKRLFEVQEQERRTIARELHDETGQHLTLIKLMLDRSFKATPEKAAPMLSEAAKEVAAVIQQVRNMSLDLRPGMLDDLGLVPALVWLFERVEKQSGLKVNFEHKVIEDMFPAEVNTAAYRIVQEAITNIIRYAGVSEASVRLNADNKKLLIEIEDKGFGFDMGKMAVGTSTGISAMRERAQLLDGKLDVESAPGQGTRITVELPVNSIEEVFEVKK